MPQGKPRTVEELKAAKARMKAEWAKLPDKSIFGDDNRAAEELSTQTFDKLIAGEDPEALQDKLYDLSGISEGMDYVTDEAIALCDWARGWEDDGFEAKE